MSTTDQQAKAPADLKNVAVFLRGSSSGIKARTGVLNGKRIDYFKGTFTRSNSRLGARLTCHRRQTRRQGALVPRLRQTQESTEDRV